MSKKKLDMKKVLIIGGIALAYVIWPLDAIPFSAIDDSTVAFIAAWLIKE